MNGSWRKILGGVLLACIWFGFGLHEPSWAQANHKSFQFPLTMAAALHHDDKFPSPEPSGVLGLRARNIQLEPARQARLALPWPASPTWNALANGLNGPVHAMILVGNDIYAGGEFTQICGNASCTSGNSPANRVARWDGSAWHAVGNGVNSAVFALVFDGTNLYAGGQFTQLCGNLTCNSGNTQANYIGKWTGSSWSTLANGLNAKVHALVLSAGELYIGGAFNAACGDANCTSGNYTVNHIAHWNGVVFENVGFGLNSTVYALASDGADIYAGGGFIQACGNLTCNSGNQNMNRVADWDGNGWSALEFGVNGSVYALALRPNALYLGGGFTRVCASFLCSSGATVNHLAVWSGGGWATFPYGVNGNVQAITVNGADIYIGGGFTQVCGNDACNSGNVVVNNLVRWNDLWYPVGHGVNTDVNALVPVGGSLYVGGGFWDACGNDACDTGNARVNRVARYGEPACAAPAKPALKSPAKNATIAKARPILKWNAANCADTYNITVKDAATGKKVDSATGLRVLQYRTKTLTKGKAYKWFVQACNTRGCTKSGTWKFTVR